ncbi:MAG: GGDEF domain-containing protein, partial [Dokdonella sp.]
MSIDIHSAITLSALLALLMGVSLSYVLRDYPDALQPSLRAWILGTLMQPLAWVLYSTRGQLADWIAIVLANALLSLAYAQLVRGLRLFAGRPLVNTLLYTPVLLVAVAAVAFTYQWPSLRWRTVSISVLLVFQFARGALSLFDRPRRLRRSEVLTMIAFGLTAGVLLVRSLFEGLHSQALTSAFAPTPMQVAVFGTAAFLPVLSTFSFVLMCNDRLNLELVRQAMRDPLTGINNRRALVDAAERMLASARRHTHPVAALLIDADHFKQINDVH